jgi:hypothetical protein
MTNVRYILNVAIIIIIIIIINAIVTDATKHEDSSLLR